MLYVDIPYKFCDSSMSKGTPCVCIRYGGLVGYLCVCVRHLGFPMKC